jgi:hypothetical protein
VIVVPSRDVVRRDADSLRSAGYAADMSDEAVRVADPCGTRVRVRARNQAV